MAANSEPPEGLKSAAEIGQLVANELATTKDLHFSVRTITNEIHRWFANNTTSEHIVQLTSEPPHTGDKRFDALIEGIVAHLLRSHGLSAPLGTARTTLDNCWAPWGDTIKDNKWYLQSVFFTPVELLAKHFVFDRNNLVRL